MGADGWHCKLTIISFQRPLRSGKSMIVRECLSFFLPTTPTAENDDAIFFWYVARRCMPHISSMPVMSLDYMEIDDDDDACCSAFSGTKLLALRELLQSLTRMRRTDDDSSGKCDWKKKCFWFSVTFHRENASMEKGFQHRRRVLREEKKQKKSCVYFFFCCCCT